jgi:pimeloyl-ACP methyl ester carboxylesterase
MQRLRVNGTDMAYLEVGQGPPLLCIHGALGDFRSWSAVLGPLTKKHRVIAVSLRHFFPEHWDGALFQLSGGVKARNRHHVFSKATVDAARNAMPRR